MNTWQVALIVVVVVGLLFARRFVRAIRRDWNTNHDVPSFRSIVEKAAENLERRRRS